MTENAPYIKIYVFIFVYSFSFECLLINIDLNEMQQINVSLFVTKSSFMRQQLTIWFRFDELVLLL